MTPLQAVRRHFEQQEALWIYDAIVRTHHGYRWFEEGIAFGYSPERIVAIALGREPQLNQRES
jgi:hypothetical protein